jgi:hypothetical protein
VCSAVSTFANRFFTKKYLQPLLAMPYSQYKSLRELKKQFSLIETGERLFPGTPDVQPSEWLTQTIDFAQKSGVAFFSEKSRSEALVFPILFEIMRRNDQQFSLYSGATLDVDKEKGLNGECDFVLSKSRQSIEVGPPVFCLVEAKDNDIEMGIPQCVAQLLGAQIFNQQDEVDLPFLYGGVTTGTEWLFLKMEDKNITLDNRRYYLDNLPQLLGALESIIRKFI